MALISPKDLIEGDIFEMLGLQDLPEDKKEETMAKLIEGVQNRVILRIDDLVGQEDQRQFHQLLDQGDDDKINKFLEEKNINVPQLVAQESLLMKSELVQIVNKEE